VLPNAVSRKKGEEKKFLNIRSAKYLTEEKLKKKPTKNYKHNYTRISSFLQTLTGSIGLQSTCLCAERQKYTVVRENKY